jgi:hypothetical protein
VKGKEGRMSNRPNRRGDIAKLGLSDDAFNRLSHNLLRLVQGSNLAIVSPIFEGRTPKNILEGWDKVYQQQAGTLRATLAEMESSNRSKFGPRSLAKPWEERRDDILLSFAKRDCETKSLPGFDALLHQSPLKARRLLPLPIASAASS